MTLHVGAELKIRRPWLRTKHWFLLLVVIAGWGALAYAWSNYPPGAWHYIGTLFVLSWSYNVCAMFVNFTQITANNQGVRVKHGPIPSPFGLNRKLQKEEIKQLYAAKHGSLFSVKAQLSSGGDMILVAPLISEEQALFVEQQLERALGIVDYAVEGELGQANFTVQGQAPAGAKSGAAIALAVPVFAIATVGLFMAAANTDVKGSLKSSGKSGNWSFSPDDCVSGQREGFGGVVLTSQASPARQVRVVADPVKGTLLVIATRGEPNQVIEAASCSLFQVEATRTNTSINDIWVVDGHITVACEGLSGDVSFEGCH